MIDFGAARSDLESHSKSVTSLATAGYAPFEQYSTSGNQGPWSDIYGLAATMYKAVTGVKPQDAPDRMLTDQLRPISEFFPGTKRSPFLSAITAGLRLRPQDRPQSVAEVFHVLNRGQEVVTGTQNSAAKPYVREQAPGLPKTVYNTENFTPPWTPNSRPSSELKIWKFILPILPFALVGFWWIFHSSDKHEIVATTPKEVSPVQLPPNSAQCNSDVKLMSTRALCEIANPPGWACGPSARQELSRRKLKVDKESCGAPLEQPEPSTPNPLRSALNDLYKVDRQVITFTDLDEPLRSTWITSIRGIIESLQTAKTEPVRGEGLIIHRNVRISPFQAVQFSVGSPDCKISNLIATAGLCNAEGRDLACAIEIDKEFELHRRSGKTAYLCISALLK